MVIGFSCRFFFSPALKDDIGIGWLFEFYWRGMSTIERKLPIRRWLVNLDEFMRIHKGCVFTQALAAFVSCEDDAHIR